MQVDKHFDLSTGISAAATTAAKKLLEMQLFATAVLKCMDRKITLAHRKLFK